MRLIHGVLLLLGVILGLLVWLLLAAEPAASTGGPHPLFAGMNVGGDGLARLGGSVWLIYWLGAAVHGLMVLLVALGVSERNRGLLFWSLLGLAALAIEVVWAALVNGYLTFLDTGTAEYVLGFPIATSWMLYGVWLAGALLCLMYVGGFRRFVFSAEDEAAYEALRAGAEQPRVPPADGEQR